MSCVAAAAMLGLEYVHVAFKGRAHGESVAAVEQLLALHRSFRVFDAAQMDTHARRPGATATWPFRLPCRHCMGRANLSRACAETWGAPGWLARAAFNSSFRATHCCDQRVWVADSCYDFLHCHPSWPRAWLLSKPTMQAAYAAAPKPPPRWLEGLPARPPLAAAQPGSQPGPGLAPAATQPAATQPARWGARVALHLRLGDVGSRLLPLGYYGRAVQWLRREATAEGGATKSGLKGKGRPRPRPPLFRVQTNGRPEEVLPMLALPPPLGLGGGGGDVAVDFSRYAANATSARRAPEGAAPRAGGAPALRDGGGEPLNVGLALHRLVTADVLVMSRSALSYAAAMLSNGTVLFPSCWLQHRRPLPDWVVWPCCPNPEEQPRAGKCKGEAGRTWKYRAVISSKLM